MGKCRYVWADGFRRLPRSLPRCLLETFFMAIRMATSFYVIFLFVICHLSFVICHLSFILRYYKRLLESYNG
ncbi:hypothetical protein PBCV1_a097R [Paramecium bursaria Chlorella virus 1]|uniref:Uncharacterized protein n=1 Tax=Paramecium bursaria Chlorella virus 1 TaxID=10506 RepID=Q84418_PBCV1|nr:hypothetical protein PBCV1_a097R [Paramecium bursaria Chlorella virus 1]AAC96465.1 hypothetical protein [Paramecium bursaria Chlorella virus 1]